MFGLVTILALVILPALASASSREASVRPPPPPPGKVRKPSLRLAMPFTSATVDPALVADEENVQLANLLYSGLVRLDASYHVVPDAAYRWTISPDHRVYTFYLRHKMKFSNGDALMAKDFRYAIERSLTPSLKSPSAPTYLLDIQGARAMLEGKAKSVSGIKVIDNYTLRITARWPVPYFLMELTYPTSYALDPKNIKHYGASDNTAWYQHPAGSGPYRLKSWIPNDKIVLTPNHNYYGAGAPLRQITISLSPFLLQGVDLYQYVSRHLDVATLPSFNASLLRQSGIRQTTMLAITGIYMSLKTKPFSNIHVRRALTLALSRSAIVRKSMGSAVTPFSGYVPPGQVGYDTQLRVLRHDDAAARRELALGGFPRGKNFPSTTLYYGVDPDDASAAIIIRRLAFAVTHAWQHVLKIPVDVHELNLNNLYEQAQTNALSVYISGWSADYPDAHDWLSSQWKTKALNNNVQYSDKKFDTLVERADVTWREGARDALYNQAQQTLVNDAAWIPLYIPHRLVYMRTSVHNLVVTGYGLIPRRGSWSQVQVLKAAVVQRHRP
ncbi:MAG: peptide ABC transporter substrate-binding protein [Chloroflexota bacterium]